MFAHIKKILLIQPPVQDFYDTDIRLQPIGLCYLKAAVKKYHPEIDVKVIDFHEGWGRATISLPRELSYLKDYYCIPDSSPFRTFAQYFHFGASYEEIEAVAAQEQPDLVGISSNFSPYYREALHCAKVIKESTGAQIVMGGSHVSCCPEMVLRHPFVDFIIRGEGERPLVALLSMLQKGGELNKVANLGYKEQGSLIINQQSANYPVDALPRPDLSDIVPQCYLHKNKPICMITSSRGCPHQCSFCSVRKVFGSKYRVRKPAAIVEEMEDRYLDGYRVFDFEDDNLTFNKALFAELCRIIEEKFQGKDIRLLAMNGISYKSLDADILAAMHRAGFTHINLALVSTNTEILRSVKRPHRVGDFTNIVKIAFDYGFEIVAYQILGLPNESLESMIDTLTFLARHPLLIGVSIFYLTPGSPIAREYKPMSDTDIFRSRSTAMAIETDHCGRNDLYTLFITARILNFLKGLDIDQPEIHIDAILQSAHAFDARTQSAIKIVKKVLLEGRLYAQTKKGLQPVKKFDAKLFDRVWQKTQFVTTQQGRNIYVNR